MKNKIDIEQQLKNMKKQTLTKEEANILWAKIQQSIRGLSDTKNTMPILGMFGKKSLVAIVTLVVLLGGSIATAAAANSAGPGDPLFPIDLAAERIRLALAFSAEVKDDLQISFAQERLEEASVAVAAASDTEVSGEVEGEIESEESATSTEDEGATSTDEDGDEDKEETAEKTRRANLTLMFAIERLEGVRANFEERGNEDAVLALDIIIEELRILADNHVENTEEIKAKIGKGRANVRAEIEASENDVRQRFKLEVRQNAREEIEERVEEIRERVEERKEEIRDRVEEQRDRIDDRIRGLFDRLEKRLGQGQNRVAICHKTNDTVEGKITIRVAGSAVQAHLSHGDTLGACNTEGDDQNEEEDQDEDMDDNGDQDDENEEENDEDEDNGDTENNTEVNLESKTEIELEV